MRAQNELYVPQRKRVSKEKVSDLKQRSLALCRGYAYWWMPDILFLLHDRSACIRVNC